MTAITAVTAQNTTGIKSIVGIEPKEISKQILFSCKDIRPDAIKIGMLHSERVIDSVIDSLRSIKVIKIVLDPVMVAKSGAQLISDNAINILKNHLIKRVSLITPNIPEAEVLTDLKIKNIHDMTQAGQVLLSMGAKNVLIKGGHLKSKVVKDIFMNKKEIKVFLNKRLKTKNTHGTGCTLSSAITTFFSCGKLLNKSCELGIKYVNQSIRSNPNFGKGHGPINHLNSITINKKFR
jgi:hydroxymethylpyrimidine/phosphomethylpyrimidine kinase